jgi:hypothetical protein
MMRFSMTFPLLLVAAYVTSVAAEMPAAWSYADAAKWARDKDLHASFVSNIKKHEVDGMTLMALEDKDVKDEMEVTSGIARKKIMAAIAALKAGATDPADNEDPPMESEGENAGMPKFYEDFTAYRAVKENRRRADFAMGILLNAPHFGVPKVGRMGLGPSDECGWLEFFFSPGLFIARNSDRFLYGLPWIANFATWSKAFEIPLAVMTAMGKGGPVAGIVVIPVVMLIQVVMYFFAVVGWYLYPIVPWFISDLLFYVMLFAPLVTTIVSICKSGN